MSDAPARREEGEGRRSRRRRLRDGHLFLSVASFAIVVPRAVLSAMILSSTSVMFTTQVTFQPEYSRYRLTVSKITGPTMWPMWLGL